MKYSIAESQWKKWDTFYIRFCGYRGGVFCCVLGFFLSFFLSFSKLQCYSFIQSCGVRIRNHEIDVSVSLIRHRGVIVLRCMTLPNFTMKIFKAVPWGVQDETSSMVISFNVFIVRNKLNTRTHVDWNQTLYYSLKLFMYIEYEDTELSACPAKEL